jgi:hypothetical protein
MNNSYLYDEIYGTLLHKNEDDTEREYFIIECLKFKFYRWMFQYGWNKSRDKPCERNGLRGFEFILQRKIGD